MLKKISALLLVLLVSGGVFAFPVIAADLIGYDNPAKRFSIMLPSNWQKTEGYMGVAVYAANVTTTAGQQLPPENISVAVESLPYTMSLTAYTQVIFSGIQHYFGTNDYKVLDQGEETIQDVNSKWMVYSYTTGPIQFDVLVYCLVRNNYGYIITGCAAHEHFNQYRQTFEAVARSMEIH